MFIILALKIYRKIDGPFLLIDSESVVVNWSNEINRFCSTLKSIILIGHENVRSQTINKMNIEQWDICLTTHEMCLNESDSLKRIQWKYLIVEKAHRLQNENGNLIKALRQFQSDIRFLLTETPLKVNLLHLI